MFHKNIKYISFETELKFHENFLESIYLWTILNANSSFSLSERPICNISINDDKQNKNWFSLAHFAIFLRYQDTFVIIGLSIFHNVEYWQKGSLWLAA